MSNINFDEIEKKYKDLIDIAKRYMQNIKDFEHDINHVNDVVYYTERLIEKLDKSVINIDVCIISAYWHDVGRIKGNEEHEKLSANMLKNVMEMYNYDEAFINECYDAIEFHKWNMNPKTLEGLIIKDADKLAWIGINRWKNCIKNNYKLDEIVNLLPKLRNEILCFEESKIIYDEDICKLIKYLI